MQSQPPRAAATPGIASEANNPRPKATDMVFITRPPPHRMGYAGPAPVTRTIRRALKILSQIWTTLGDAQRGHHENSLDAGRARRHNVERRGRFGRCGRQRRIGNAPHRPTHHATGRDGRQLPDPRSRASRLSRSSRRHGGDDGRQPRRQDAPDPDQRLQQDGPALRRKRSGSVERICLRVRHCAAHTAPGPDCPGAEYGWRHRFCAG